MKSTTPIDPAIQEYAKKVGVQVGQLLAELLAEGMSITHESTYKPEESEARDPTPGGRLKNRASISCRS